MSETISLPNQKTVQHVDGNHAHLAIISIEFIIPESRSLKSKRKTIRSIIERIRAKHNVSVSEIAYMDKWQRALIGICMISNSRSVIEKCNASIELLLRDYAEIEITDIHFEWI